MHSALIRRRFAVLAAFVSLSQLVACGGSDEHATAPTECHERACDGGASGSGGSGEELLDCPELCREVAECSGEVDAACRGECEDTLAMADSLGCGPNYAGYVNCVLDAGDACVRERPPQCTVAYDDLDACLCAAFPEGCP